MPAFCKPFLSSPIDVNALTPLQCKLTQDDSLYEYELSSQDTYWLLSKWYRLNLLDLLTTQGAHRDTSKMANRFGISVNEVEQSLLRFKEAGLAKQNEDGSWSKVDLKLRFPTTTTQQTIRNYHQSQLKRALFEIEQKTLPRDFSNRLFIGLSIACNPLHLEKVKEYLQLAAYQAAEILSQDPCSEVYQLNLQLFPQTKTR